MNAPLDFSGYTCGPDIGGVVLVLYDKVEDVTSVVSPQVQLEAEEGGVGHDEVLALGWTCRSASQCSSCQHLGQKLGDLKWY